MGGGREGGFGEEQQKLAVEVLSLYLEVDSSRMAELVTSSQVVDSLVGRGKMEKSLIRRLFIGRWRMWIPWQERG